MGLIGSIFATIFGGGRNVVAETVEVFRPNAEAQAMRDAAQQAAALAQFAAEFGIERKGWFDRFIDGLNRLPRPMLAFGTLGLFAAAMIDPVWFAKRMQGIALVPEPLWWLMGAIVSFYFGARHQTKTQEFQRGMAATLARAEQVTGNIAALDALDDAPASDRNPAFDAWRASRDD
ncbi:MAG: holin family protein [Pseudomonadota bacterium]